MVTPNCTGELTPACKMLLGAAAQHCKNELMSLDLKARRLDDDPRGCAGARRTRRRRGVVAVTSGLLLIMPLAAWVVTSTCVSAVTDQAAPLSARESGEARAVVEENGPDVEQLLKTDPMAVVRLGRERFTRSVSDWRAILTKQELLPNGLSAVQEIEVRCRALPQTLYLLWRKNASGVRRALYAPGDPRFVDGYGRALARVEPNGALVRLITTDVFVQIHGPDARKNSRRTIDECGFAAIFASLERVNARAAARGVLDLRYVGPGEIDGRPTFRIVRNLPASGPDAGYPDRRMVLHLDQDWLLPVAVYSYGDTEETQLLGSYVFTKVELNPGLGDASFAFGP